MMILGTIEEGVTMMEMMMMMEMAMTNRMITNMVRLQDHKSHHLLITYCVPDIMPGP